MLVDRCGNFGIICTKGHVSPTFDISNDDHNEEAVVVGMVGVVNPCGDFTGAYNFLQGDQHQLDGQETHTFIEEVQGAVKDEVPAIESDTETG